MVKRLKYISTIKLTGWRLPLKALFASLVLISSYFLGPLWSIIIIFAYFLAVFGKEPAEKKMLGVSFWTLVLTGFLGVLLLKISALPFGFVLILSLIFGILVFVVLGLINFVFLERFAIYGIFNVALLILVFTEIFYLKSLSLSWLILVISSLALFFAIFSIFKEVFGFFGIIYSKKTLITSIVLGFLALELYWTVSFLPLGYINAAAFLALIFLLVRDTLLVHFQGFLDLPFVFRELTFFLLLSLTIFAVSNWSI